jgi:hypothetical protein
MAASETMAPVAAPPPPPTPHPAELRDFPDRLSPMLVKELRQGTRTRLFAAAFITVQAVLALTLFASVGYGGEASGAVMWWILVIVLLVVMPLRGFNALANEERLKTMDLILLTRLTSLRITAGKWAALVSQSALFVAAVLPYIVLRYFLGGVNIIYEIVTVAGLFLISCVFTAFTVGFSAHRLFLIRGGVALGVLFCAFMVGQWLFFALTFGGWMGFDLDFEDAWAGYAYLLLVGSFACYYALDMGATFIAPAAENHSSRKRLVAGAVVVVLVIAAVVAEEKGWAGGTVAFYTACVIAALASFDALSEQPVLIRSIFAPFVRFGLAGRLAGRFLYPGWHTGTWFTLALAGVVGAAGFWTGWFELPDESMAYEPVSGHNFVALVALFLLPAAVIQLFFRRSTHFFGLSVLVQCVLSLYALLLAVIVVLPDVPDTVYIAGCFVPLVLIIGPNVEYALIDPFFVCALVLVGVSVLVLAARGFPVFVRTGQLEAAVRAGSVDTGSEVVPSAPQ